MSEAGLVVQLKLRFDTSALDRAQEALRKAQKPIVVTLEELRRAGPGFEVRIPGMDLVEQEP